LEKQKEKIWYIASERYKGWRGTLSTTYRASKNYAERIGNVPEDIDLVEWHYLLLYFRSEEFKVNSSKCTLTNKLYQLK